MGEKKKEGKIKEELNKLKESFDKISNYFEKEKTLDKAQTREDEMRDGFQDGLEPLEPLDLSKVKSFNDMARAMSKTAFAGRSLGEAVDVLEAMVKDKDCFVVLTLAGAMTPAKMGLVACEMIEHGMVNAVVSTGALMTHGFVEAQGMTHFKYKFGEMNDKELYYRGYDRIYDIIELEKNLDDTELIFRKVMKNLNPDETLCSRKILEECGKWLTENTKGRGILKSAYEKKIPVYVPAFTDCEMGLDFGILNLRRKKFGEKEFNFNPFLDLNHFTELIIKQKTIGVFTIGGGVPRNWAQQIAPYIDIMRKRMENECPACHGKGCEKCGNKGYLKDTGVPGVMYKYGVRICPEPVHFGGLSGCTYSEGVSWGKFLPKEDGGRWAEVLCDATVAWPIIIKAVMERLEK